MKRQRQMSETIRLGMVLALSGGFMDAYSYIVRDQVFANAQTGNMLLFGVYLSEGKFHEALQYFFPVFAFALGIALAEFVHVKATQKLHWRQIAVILEAVILVVVAGIPLSLNLLANSLTSFACGIQVESFRKIHGNGIATTMCIGNMRSGTQNLCTYYYGKDKQYLRKAVLYYGIILCFILGAVIGNLMIQVFAQKAILFCTIILLIAFLMMFVDYEQEEENDGDFS